MRSLNTTLVISARQLFDPPTVPLRPPQRNGRALVGRACRDLRPRPCLRMLLAFYREPLAWFGLLLSAFIIAYAGGIVMFVLHAVVLGEQGPAISPVEHWALDSTLGFVGLGPVVALILPIAAWIVSEPDEGVRTLPFAAVGGVLFALAAGPGPIAHDLLVGRGTWLANRVTDLLGGDTTVLAAHAHGDGIPQTLSIGMQVAIGVPTYVLLVWLALTAVRSAVRHREAFLRARTVLTEVE